MLVADIGGTHARFALGDDAGNLSGAIVLATQRMGTAAELIADALSVLGADVPERICLAVAGPVTDGRVRITNHGAVFDGAELSREFGAEFVLVNDFVALAHSVPYLNDLQQIGGDADSSDNGVKALIGPGSGCGMAVLLPIDGQYRVFPSEGGHADLAVTNPLEAELWVALARRVSHVCWEAVLSGPGLVNLHAALCEVWGVEPADMTAADISAAGVDVDDPICHQTLELFFGFLGTAAGNLAVTTMATGGVYIGGGIVPRLADFARSSPLRRRFEERGMLTDVVRQIPLYLVLDEMPGLAGAARYLVQQPRR
jgi:glucokinase